MAVDWIFVCFFFCLAATQSLTLDEIDHSRSSLDTEMRLDSEVGQ